MDLLLLDVMKRVMELLAPRSNLLANKLRNAPLLHGEIKPRKNQKVEVGRLEVVLAIQI